MTKFKIGDRVRIIVDCSQCGVQEVNGGLGMVGEIFKIYRDFLVYLKSNDFLNVDKNLGWAFKFDQVELVKPEAIRIYHKRTSKKCPRCGEEMVKKLNDGLLYSGQQEEIEKCSSCGYC